MKMKAIYLSRYGEASKAFEIKETNIPTPAPDEVVIKCHSSGLNFADVVARRGLYPDAPKNPAVIGYDVTGYVHAIGKDVSQFKEGDRVAALTRFGGYAEYAKTFESGVAHLPNNINFAKGTALATQGCTAYYCAVHCVNLLPDDKVLIQAAAGGVGIILTQIATHQGCIVFGTASNSKIDFLTSNGVNYPIPYNEEDFEDRIRETLNGNKLNFVFDSIGGKAFKKGWKLLEPTGTMVNLGAAAQISGSNKLKSLGVALGFGFFSPIQLLLSSKSMVAVNMLRVADHRKHVFKKTFDGVMQYSKEGIIQPKIHKIYRAEEISAAHLELESRKSIGKIVIEW